jgi:DNA-directed RNA polymerase subunit L
MSVDHYIFNVMRQILINNIKIHMNVYSVDMRSSEIANLTILVEVQNVKTFYQKNMQTTELNNSTNIKNTANYL